MDAPVSLTVNGRACTVDGDADRTLLDALRHALDLKATRLGCGLGQCGACTVLVDGRATTACNTPLGSVAGRAVTTLEGLGTRELPHPLQAAFIEEQALQCGWCTSGMILRAAQLLREEPRPGEARIREALAGHLCRCGAHPRIVRAVQRAAGSLAAP
ncbi:(2Fe-2S)-binding protein [Ramlibacter sp. MAHUQ-53]|uniref:(2Fe-2S)-binding protein n=1 Tax=unclassified Ramlibacter TaxID=2617605 RepID=UPI0036455332